MKSTDKNAQNCPLCQQVNHCRVEDLENCWCKGMTFSKQLIEKIKSNNQPTACICQRCAEKFGITTNDSN